jgi:hypothetical protein
VPVVELGRGVEGLGIDEYLVLAAR